MCDEPISALDVSIQAQIINMFEELQEDLGLTYLFIAHDLNVVRHISNRIGVMYLGKLVELAESNELTFHSLHPYTKSLISAIPIPDPVESRSKRGSSWKGTCRVRWIRRPDAGSGRDAPMLRRSAPSRA